jgi:methionyl-tRNA synthetase
MERVSFDEFQKITIKVGKVKEVYRIENSKKLLRVLIDLGEEGTKQAVAGISKYYTPESLAGKTVIVVTNLEPKTMAGYTSEVMLLAAFNEKDLSLLTTDKEMPPGTKVS